MSFLKRHKRLIILFAVSLLVFVSGGMYIGYQYGPNFNFYLIPPTPKRDAILAFNKISSTGIHRENQTQKTKLKEIGNTILKKSTYKEVYPLLKQALKIKGGKHSSLVSPEESKKNISQYKKPTISVKNNVLYVHLPEFTGSTSQAKKYATTVYHKIAKQKYTGIIIDLSDNRGGDIGPMLAGTSPIIPNGKIFSIVNANGETTNVSLRGSVTDNMGTNINLGKIRKIKNTPIAVILNRWTASSGELTDLALANNSDVKTFGEKSAGYTSINSTYSMYNGTQINITTDKVKKNNGQILFNDKIKPDITTKEPIIKAKEWISTHNEFGAKK